MMRLKGVLMKMKRLRINGGCTDTQRRHHPLMLVFLLCLLVLSVGMTAAAKETLNQTNLTLLKGRSASLKVRGMKKKVRFTSSKRSVATVNAKGKVTAKKKGTAVITAKVGRKKLKCKVVVLQPVTKLTLSSRGIVMTEGDIRKLKANAAPVSANNKSVHWTSSDENIVRVDQSGNLEALQAGAVVISATTMDGSGKDASCRVTVKGRPAPMTISQSSLVLETGASHTLTVSNTDGAIITWGSSDPNVVSVSKGTVVGAASGTAVITAQKADGTQAVRCSITVIERKRQTEPTAAAKRFLSILQGYSDQVRADQAAGRLWGYSNKSKRNPKTWSAAKSDLKTKGISYNNCALLARLALRDMGILGENQNFWGTPEGGIHFNGGVAARLRKRCAIISAYDTPNNLIAEGKLLPGDICTWTFDYNHTNIYAGNGLWYDAGRGSDGGYVSMKALTEQYGIDRKNLESDNGTSSMFIFNSFGPYASINMDRAVVGQIIRVMK